MDKHWIVFDFIAAGMLVGNSIHVFFTTDWLLALLCTISGVLFFIGGIVRIKKL
jgi:hypothetical protein